MSNIWSFIWFLGYVILYINCIQDTQGCTWIDRPFDCLDEFIKSIFFFIYVSAMVIVMDLKWNALRRVSFQSHFSNCFQINSLPPNEIVPSKAQPKCIIPHCDKMIYFRPHLVLEYKKVLLMWEMSHICKVLKFASLVSSKIR